MASSMLSEEDVLRDLEALTDDDDSTSDPTYNQPRKEPNSHSSDDVGFLHLPEEIIVMILRFLPTSELNQSVVRVCKSLNVIVNSNSILWSHFEDFPVDVLEFESKQLSRIMKHSHCFKYFEIPYSRFLFPETLVSDILSFKLLQSIHLHTLDLTSVPISSLGFLCNMPDLRILNIRGGTLVAISDNCTGQNKNWNIQFLWLYFIACGRFDHVEHHFPLSGHSMLPSDRDFAHIENHVRHRVQYVFTPENWRQIIAKSSEKLSVTEMKMDDFLKLSSLKQFFTVRTKTVDGNPAIFKNGVRFRILSGEAFGLIEISSSFNTDVWDTVTVNKRGRRKTDIATSTLPLKYSGPRALDQLKVADVRSLITYIPPVHHGFYSRLKSAGQTESDSDSGSIE